MDNTEKGLEKSLVDKHNLVGCSLYNTTKGHLTGTVRLKFLSQDGYSQNEKVI